MIIPTYNRASLIGEAIQSVIQQTYRDWELVVVDDGSSDDTPHVVAAFGQRVRYLRQDNAGVCVARNAGLAAATGQYISFLDSDDLMLPHNLEILATLLDERPAVDVAYGWGYFCRQDEGRRELMDYQRVRGPIPRQIDAPWEGTAARPGGTRMEGHILPKLLLKDSMLLGGNLIRRAWLEAVGGFDPSINYMEHWDLYLRLSMAGAHFTCSQQTVMLYRNHTGNRFRDHAPMLRDHLKVIDRIFADPSWQSRLAAVKGQAYHFAYFEDVLANFAYGQPRQGIQSLNAALVQAPLNERELKLLVGCMARRILDDRPANPLPYAYDLLVSLAPAHQTQRLYSQVLALVYMALAFREYRVGNRPKASQYALAAVRRNRTFWRNRGLARLVVEGLGGRHLLDWVRASRQHIMRDLAERIGDRPCLFLSPHFDDVVLSCGGTLALLAHQSCRVILVTVFTGDQGEAGVLSPLAQQMHALWGGAAKPMETRKREDRATTESLQAEYRWLEFPETIYRDAELKEDELLLPAFKPREDACFESLEGALARLLAEYPRAVVFAPLALGHHRDHLLVHEAIRDATRCAGNGCTLLYYEDFPYVLLADRDQRLAEIGQHLEPLVVDMAATLAERVRLTQMHASQMPMLFGDAAKAEREIRAYARRVGSNGQARERFWCSREALAALQQ